MCSCNDRWVVTYPPAEGETEPRTEEFVREAAAIDAVARVPGASYALKQS